MYQKSLLAPVQTCNKDSGIELGIGATPQHLSNGATIVSRINPVRERLTAGYKCTFCGTYMVHLAVNNLPEVSCAIKCK